MFTAERRKWSLSDLQILTKMTLDWVLNVLGQWLWRNW